MATVVLLRHGRTTANATGVLAGRVDASLDEVGLKQAESAARRLATTSFAAVVTSPMRRCTQTVEALAAQREAPSGLIATIEHRFNEFEYGDWQGQPLAELRKQPLWTVVQSQPSAVVFPNGGSMAAHAAGATLAVREWNAKITESFGPDAIWLACTHGDVVKAIVADALGMHLDFFQRITVDPGSITVIRYSDTRPQLIKLNDTDGSVLEPHGLEAETIGGGPGPTTDASRVTPSV